MQWVRKQQQSPHLATSSQGLGQAHHCWVAQVGERLVQESTGHRGKMTVSRYLTGPDTLVAAVQYGHGDEGAAAMLREYARVGSAPPPRARAPAAAAAANAPQAGAGTALLLFGAGCAFQVLQPS